MRLLLQHLARRILAAQPHPTCINSHIAIVDLHRQFVSAFVEPSTRIRRLSRDAGAVDHDVQTAVLADRAGDGGLEGLRVRDVAFDEGGEGEAVGLVGGAGGVDDVDGRGGEVDVFKGLLEEDGFGGVGLEVGVDDEGAGGGVGEADGAAEAGGAAGDEGDFAGEVADVGGRGGGL